MSWSEDLTAVRALYRMMRLDDLVLARRAFVLDREQAFRDHNSVTEKFCNRRIKVIDELLDEIPK